MSQGVASNLAQQLSQSRKSRPQELSGKGFLKGTAFPRSRKLCDVRGSRSKSIRSSCLLPQ